MKNALAFVLVGPEKKLDDEADGVVLGRSACEISYSDRQTNKNNPAGPVPPFLSRTKNKTPSYLALT